MSRNKHRRQAVPAEIVAEGSAPTSADTTLAFVMDADPTESGGELDSLEAESLTVEAVETVETVEAVEAVETVEAVEAVEADSADGPLPTELEPVTLRKLVEALVFAADKPISLQRLRQLTRVTEVARLEQALAELAQEYQDRGIALHEVSGGYQFRTHTAFSAWVQQLIAGRPVRLSRAQLETLAIIAYRQPITRPEIDEIRGVDSSATLRLLLDRSLVRILGKREEVGRPMLYGTTKEFLEFFSLTDLRELPTLREYSELTAESRKVVTDRLGSVEALGAMGGAATGSAVVQSDVTRGSSSVAMVDVVDTSDATAASAAEEPSDAIESLDGAEMKNAADATDGADVTDGSDVIDADGADATDGSDVIDADVVENADATDATDSLSVEASSEVMESTEVTESDMADLAGTYPAGRVTDDESSEFDDESSE